MVNLALGLAIGALIIAVGIGLVGKGDKKKRTKNMKTFLVIAAIAFVGTFSAVQTALPFLGTELTAATFAAGDGATDGDTAADVLSAAPIVGGSCIGIEDTTVTIAAADWFTGAATGGTHAYRLNGAPIATVSDGGTFTASPGDNLEIFYQNGSKSQAYFSAVENVVVPCAGTKTFSTNLVSNGTMSIKLFNEDEDVITSTNAVAETLAAGDDETLKIELKGVFQQGYQHGGVIIFEFNDTTYDNVVGDFGLPEVSTPSAYDISNLDQDTSAFEFPPILSNVIVPGTVRLDVSSSVSSPSLNGNITVTIRASNFYTDEDQGAIWIGPAVEDEDNVFVSGSEVTGTLSVIE